MTNIAIGRQAEAAVAADLERQGYKILDLNWKTKLCEIDVIARKDKIIYFVEVKYRAASGQGSGFEYITPKKLGQMQFAARLWNQTHDCNGDYRLLGAEVSGLNFEHINLVEIN
ncbi:hypothetical protein BVY00_00635 [bacterium G20]|nr:hypothetical protein BVY00_00635 [bacterium G20]